MLRIPALAKRNRRQEQMSRIVSEPTARKTPEQRRAEREAVEAKVREAYERVQAVMHKQVLEPHLFKPRRLPTVTFLHLLCSGRR